jgi:hypothetical protein
MAVLFVVLSVLALALPEFTGFSAKARATGAFMLSRLVLLDRTADAAESGRLADSSAGQRGGPEAVERALAALPEDDALVAAATGRSRRAAAAPPQERMQVLTEPPFVVVRGVLRDGGAPLRLSWTPAFALDGPAPAVLLWLCGERPPPPGWFALRDPQPSEIPNTSLFAVCRDASR